MGSWSGDISVIEREPRHKRAGNTQHPFDRCFERLGLAGRDRVLIAVSGGSDSAALLHLFRDFARRRNPALELVAVTVDHGLRAEAVAEARQVGAWAKRLGISHVVKRWTGEKPKTGLMEAARDARHRLLAEAAIEAGTDLVLVGHTLDDQAETVAMRGKRGSGRGASGMAEATLYDWTTWFARPLLGVRRAALRQALTDAGHGWIDDPSNEDMRYERVRVRTALDEDTIQALGREARNAAAVRQALGRRAAALIDRHASTPVPGLIRLDPVFVAREDSEVAIYALRVLLAMAGGQAHLPDEARTAELFGRLAKGPCKATLSLAVAEHRKGAIFIYRERRNLPQQVPFAASIWDGRFRLAGTAGEGLHVGVPDAAPKEVASDDVPPSLVRAAAAGLPALWADGQCLGLAPGTRGITCMPVVASWARYLPSFDLEIAGAAARLVGAKKPSRSPFAGHKGSKA